MATQTKQSGRKAVRSRATRKTSRAAPSGAGSTGTKAKARSSSSSRTTGRRPASSSKQSGKRPTQRRTAAKSGRAKGAVGSRAFARAKRAANKVLGDPAEARKLEQRATKKAGEHKADLTGAFDDLQALLRLIRAYSKKEYRELPKRTVVAAAGAVIYFVMPVDFIPDPIPGFGYLDDVAVLLFVVDAISEDLKDFRAWEQNGGGPTTRTGRKPSGAKPGGSATKSKATPRKKTTRKAAVARG